MIGRECYTEEELMALKDSTKRALGLTMNYDDPSLLPKIERLGFSVSEGDICMDLMGNVYRVERPDFYTGPNDCKLHMVTELSTGHKYTCPHYLTVIPGVVFHDGVDSQTRDELEIIIKGGINYFKDKISEAVLTVGSIYVYSNSFAEYLLYRTIHAK